MTAPKPDVVDQAVADAITNLEQLRDEYRIAHDSSYERRRGGRRGSGGGGEHDVSMLVAGTTAARGKVLEMGKAALRACSNARRARVLYGEWTDVVDEGRDLTLTDPAVLRSVFSETRASWAQNQADGQEAAARRAARGASLPGRDYPVGDPHLIVDGPARRIIEERRAG